MTDALSATFAALADPTRRSILAQLANGEATVNELAAPYAMSLPSVSRHLKVLEKAGLVSKGRTAQWRPCRLEVGQLRTADEWMAPYRKFFESRFDRLEEHLKEMVADKDVPDTRPPGRSKAIEQPTKQATARRKAARESTPRTQQPRRT
jgi:DNA-binding transcriptional ArsR family regulator